MIISFIGMDGTGKTTTARQLIVELAKQEKKVVYLNMLGGDSLLRRFLSRLTRRVKRRELKDPYRVSKGIVIRFWPLFSLIDAYLTYIWLRILSTKKTVIVDRYFYDEIVIMVCIGLINVNTALRFIKLMPRPDKIYLFHTDAETAYIRKPEHPYSFFEKQEKVYPQVALSINATTIDTGKTNALQVKELI